MSGAARSPDRGGRWARIIACVIALLLGLSFGAGAIWVVADQRRLEAAGETVDGVVTRIESRRDTRFRAPQMEHRPVLRFRTRDGTEVEAVAADLIEPDALSPGRALRVTYDPADPSAPRLAAEVEAGPGSTPWVLGTVAVLLVLGGVWGLRREVASV